MGEPDEVANAPALAIARGIEGAPNLQMGLWSKFRTHNLEGVAVKRTRSGLSPSWSFDDRLFDAIAVSNQSTSLFTLADALVRNANGKLDCGDKVRP